MIPTRFIEKEEFDELMNQEDDVIPLFLLAAIPFSVPGPGEEWENFSTLPEVHVLLMNAKEPCLYRDPESKMGFVILPSYAPDTYYTHTQFQEIHPVKGAWGYRLAPSGWEEGDWDWSLNHAIYRFDNGEVPEKWEVNN